MKLTNKVSFPGVQQFEQYSVEITIEDVDFPKAIMDSTTILEKIHLFNTIVAIQGVLFQYAKGFISREEYDQQRLRLVSLLAPKLQLLLQSIIKAQNGTTA